MCPARASSQLRGSVGSATYTVAMITFSASRASLQAGGHLGVGGLGELGVELADRKQARRVQAHELVGTAAGATPGPIGWRDRHGERHPACPLGAGHLTGGTRRRPGGDAIVDHYDRAAREWKTSPVAPEPPGTSLQLGPLACLHRGHLGLGDAGQPDHLVIDDPHAVLTDRTHIAAQAIWAQGWFTQRLDDDDGSQNRQVKPTGAEDST